MTVHIQSVALLAARSAFADIVLRTLEERSDYRVSSFSSVEALTTFMRIAPVHVVLVDTELPSVSPIQVMQNLRANTSLAYPLFKTIVLTRAAKPFQQPILATGVDLVLRKPVPPRQLLEAIDGLRDERRLVASSGQNRPFSHGRAEFDAPSAQTRRIGNVIPLFGEGRSPR